MATVFRPFLQHTEIKLFPHSFRFTSLMLFLYGRLPSVLPSTCISISSLNTTSFHPSHCISLPSFIFVSRLFCLWLEIFCACHPQPWHQDFGFWKGTEASRQLIIRAKNLEGCRHTDTPTNPHENTFYTHTQLSHSNREHILYSCSYGFSFSFRKW